MSDFFEEEFRGLSKKIKKTTNGLSVEQFLRIKNFKSQAPSKNLDEIKNITKNILKEELLVNILRSLTTEIHGIDMSTATTILSMRDPEKYAILDNVLLKFFTKKNITINTKLKKIFGIKIPDTRLKKARKDLKNYQKELQKQPKNSRNYKKISEAYESYLSILKNLKKRTEDLKDLRDVELKLWNTLRRTKLL